MACLPVKPRESSSRKQPYAALQHPLSMIRLAPHWRQPEDDVMEIAAIVMCAAVVMGFLQQFDRQTW
jgi:hypothetical protein